MQRPVLVYDGECGFCRRAIAWYGAHDPAQRLEYLARQSTERTQRYPQLSAAQYQGSIQLILPNGSIRSGADATALAFTYMRGNTWPMVGRALQLWGIRQCAQMGYRWIAKNRHRFTCKDKQCVC